MPDKVDPDVVSDPNRESLVKASVESYFGSFF
jgi:hypothetical protein